jgi:hypothetical protein
VGDARVAEVRSSSVCSLLSSSRSPHSRPCTLLFSADAFPLAPRRYLIDKDLDDEGLRVIADFGSGGNMDDPLARAEFTEIKEAILADVRLSSSPILHLYLSFFHRVPRFFLFVSESVLSYR